MYTAKDVRRLILVSIAQRAADHGGPMDFEDEYGLVPDVATQVLSESRETILAFASRYEIALKKFYEAQDWGDPADAFVEVREGEKVSSRNLDGPRTVSASKIVTTHAKLYP